MKLELTGTAPLLMHNIRLANSLDPFTRAIADISGKRSKTDADRLEMARLEFLGSLYHDESIGVYIPAENVFRAFMNAATAKRKGKAVEQGVIIQGSRFPLQYDGPRDPDKLWGTGLDSPFVDQRMVNVMGKRIARTRPIFAEWSVEFDVFVDTETLDEEEFIGFAKRAGLAVGLGDFRRFYGKFSVEVTE